MIDRTSLFLDGTAEREATAAARSDIPVNPKLPKNFDNTANQARPQSHQRWWYRPFIETYTWEQMCGPIGRIWGSNAEERRAKWLHHWPTGTRYDVRCLDGGAWDRSTWWGSFATLEEAIACAQRGPSWRARSAGK
jgi:hypothetical protein